MKFAEEKVLLKKYRHDPAAEVPQYDEYVLENAVVRETFAAEEDKADAGGAVVYFLRDTSVCRTVYGDAVAFPRLAKGDRCVLHAGTEDEVSMRVAEAGYFTGGALAHVRVRLK